MTARHLSDAFVRKVRPPRPDDKPRQRVYLDTIERGLALCLVVSYGGTKAFRCITYVNGKAKSRKLGTYPQMSVKEARELARAYWENPTKFAQAAQVGSFKEVAENWIKRHVQANGLRTEYEIRRHLAVYIYPKWQDRPFLEIRRHEVNALLDHVADNHGRSQADAVLCTIRAICTWHQSRDENYVSPIVRGMRRNKAKKARSRMLSDHEIRALWEACDQSDTYGALAKMLLMTAQRRDKVVTMKWTDVRDGEWVIPSQEREKGTAGKLNLPAMALAIIDQQPRIMGNPHVFAGRGRGPFNSFSQGKEQLGVKLPDMAPWVLHDLRRTARSLMSRAGVRPDISERVLGHAIPGVQGVYDVHSYDAEKADALKRLADLIDRIVNPPEGNVVPLRG